MPLNFRRHETRDLHGHTYGELQTGVLRQRNEVNLCAECAEYLRGSRIQWKSAWAAILLSKLQNVSLRRRLWSLLPTNLRRWWGHLWDVAEDVPWFVDTTCRNNEFEEAIQSLKIVRLKAILDEECMRTVRCPWGCWEYVEECRTVSFAHVVQMVGPTTSDRRSNHVKRITNEYCSALDQIGWRRWPTLTGGYPPALVSLLKACAY